MTSENTLSKPPEVPFVYVDSDAVMDDMLGSMADSGSIAIDTEADSLYHYYQKVCLIQLTFCERNYIVDPLSGVGLEKFFKVLSHKPLILHDAAYDLRMMKLSFDFYPKGEVFDTMVAGQLLGYHHLGLSAMLEEFFGVQLAKTGQKSDWSRRPLSKALLRYASTDTFYLHRLADMMREKLEALGRLSWHEESCDKVVQSAMEDKPEIDADQAWRIKGTKQLGKGAFAMMRELWHWRERESQKADIPPFKVMAPKLLIHLAAWAAGHPKMPLSKGPRLARNCSGRRLEELKKAIAIAHNMPESQQPGHLKPKKGTRPAPETETMVDALRDEIAEIAEGLQLAPQVIASRAMLKAVAIKRPRTLKEITHCGGILNWQAKLLHEPVKRIIPSSE